MKREALSLSEILMLILVSLVIAASLLLAAIGELLYWPAERIAAAHKRWYLRETARARR